MHIGKEQNQKTLSSAQENYHMPKWPVLVISPFPEQVSPGILKPLVDWETKWAALKSK